MVDGAAGHHQTWVERSSRDSAKGVPCPVVKPVPEAVEAIRDQVFRRPEVEPRIDYGDVSQHSTL